MNQTCLSDSFAGNPSLIAKYLHHVVEVPLEAERTTVLTIPAPNPSEDWRTAYHKASDVRAAAGTPHTLGSNPRLADLRQVCYSHV